MSDRRDQQLPTSSRSENPLAPRATGITVLLITVVFTAVYATLHPELGVRGVLLMLGFGCMIALLGMGMTVLLRRVGRADRR